MENVFQQLGTILNPNSQRCGCVNINMGSYDNSTDIHDLAPHMIAYLAEGKGFTFISVDKCIEREVKHLWSFGITTTASCCGHNKADPFISVIEADIPKMKALGYEVQYNNCRPNAQDSFKPKSI